MAKNKEPTFITGAEILRRQIIQDRMFYESLYMESYVKAVERAVEREREIRELERLYGENPNQP